MELTDKTGSYKVTNDSFYLEGFPVFRTILPDKTQALKVLEESSEFVEAAKIWIADPDSVQREQMLDEAADICQALSNFLYAAHVSPLEWKDARLHCIKRNNDRNRY